MVNKIFVNLPVTDLKKSMEFFGKLGFKFDPKFTNDDVACMILGDKMYVMLLMNKFFKSFNDKKELVDAKKNSEVIVSLMLNSKKEVDEMIKRANLHGAKSLYKPVDHGWMYQNNFEDLDGHQWEMFYMDVKKMPANLAGK